MLFSFLLREVVSILKDLTLPQKAHCVNQVKESASDSIDMGVRISEVGWGSLLHPIISASPTHE